MSILLEDLITHRFRGFSAHENTIAGLTSALDYGVKQFEFDVRVTRCGTPIIYHDEDALSGTGDTLFIKNIMDADRQDIGGAFAIMPTLDDLLANCANHMRQDVTYLIDIKDAGFEEMINAVVYAHRLQNQVIYVSWLPDVLFRLSDISPQIPLCLSHWPKTPSDKIRSLHMVHEYPNGHVKPTSAKYIHGQRSGCYLKSPLQGELLERLVQSLGSVCIPEDMTDAETVAYYHSKGLKVSSFSFVTKDDIAAHKNKYGTDYFFIDDSRVFDGFI